MRLEGVLMNVLTILKMTAIFQNGCQLYHIGNNGRFLFPKPIILCNSTFLRVLRSRKLNLTFLNSKWPPF